MKIYESIISMKNLGAVLSLQFSANFTYLDFHIYVTAVLAGNDTFWQKTSLKIEKDS